MFDLTGKVAVVTGGAGGLGRRYALGLARCGADMVVADLDSAHLEAVVKDIRGRDARPSPALPTSPALMR